MIMPVRAGGALAATVAVAYSICTLAFLLWPETAANFGRFFYVLAMLSVSTFWFGALFGWLFERLGSASWLTPRSVH